MRVALLCIVAFQSLLPVGARSEALPDRGQGGRQGQDSADAPPMLRAIRRVGILPGTNNLEDFRSFLRNDSQGPRGLAAEPISARDLEQVAARMLVDAAGETGRFWVLRETPFEVPSADARAKLAERYDLDAWLAPEIVFAPDHTLVRAALRPRSAPFEADPSALLEPALAREDVLLEAHPSREAVQRAFGKALARIISTLGHDGALTFQQDDLVVSDFGLERGLAPGSEVAGGIVLLRARHPAGDEVLRVERIPLMTLKVLEVRQGSALLKVVARDRLRTDELRETLGLARDALPPLLAWRVLPTAPSTGWTGNIDAPLPPIVGSAPRGFSGNVPKERPVPIPPGKKEVPGNRVQGNGEEQESPMGEGLPPRPAPLRESRADLLKPEDEARGGDPAEKLPDGASSNGAEGFPAWADIGSWRPHSLALGLAYTGGALSTTRGLRNTGFPYYVLNTAFVAAELEIMEGLFLAPRFTYSAFSGWDVEGTRGEGGIMALAKIFDQGGQGFEIQAGGGIAGTFGQADTVLLKQDLTTLEGVGVIAARKRFPGIGLASAAFELSVSGLLYGHAEGALEMQLTRMDALPKPLGIHLRTRAGPEAWLELLCGVSWDVSGGH